MTASDCSVAFAGITREAFVQTAKVFFQIHKEFAEQRWIYGALRFEIIGFQVEVI